MTDSAAPVGAHSTVVEVVPDATAVIYVADDAVGNLLTFENAFRVKKASLNTLTVASALLMDDSDGQAHSPMELWLFNATFTPTADHDEFTLTKAVLLTCVGVIKWAASDYTNAKDNAIALVTPQNFVIESATTGQTSLFGQLKTTGTPDYDSTTDLKIRLGLLQD